MTTFDPANPATYDSGFKAFIRRKGLAGKEVDVDQVRALYDEFGGYQAQDTEKATSLFAGIPDPTPNATAASADTSFVTPRMDLTDITALTGSGGKDPIMSTVQQVTKQEQQAAQQEAPPEDPVGIFYRERVAPVINNFRQRRQQVDNDPNANSFERRMALGAINSDIEANVSRLQEAGVFGDQELNYYKSLTTEDKELPREEALFRTFQFKMSPKEQTQGGVVVNEQTNKALELATKNYESAVRFAEANPEDIEAQAAARDAAKTVKTIQKSSGISTEPDYIGEYKQTRKTVESLMNAQRDRIPAIIVDDKTVAENDYDDAIKGYQVKLGTLEASPDFRNAVPVIDKNTFKDPKDWIAAVQAAGGIYRESSGRLVTPQRFEEEEKKARFKTFKPPANEVAPVEADKPKEIPVGEKNMIRYAIEKGEDLTNTRFSPEMIATVREEMNEEQIEGALRSLYAGNSWASKVGLRNPTIKDEDLSGMLGRTDDPEAAKFLSGIDPETVKRVYEKADRLQGFSARAYKNEDGTWSQKVDTPDMVLSRIRKLASQRGK